MAASAKVEAVRDMPCAIDIAGIQHLNGFVSYLTKFPLHLANMTKPIQQLTGRKHTIICRVETAILLSEMLVLRFPGPAKELTIYYDASQTVLGAALLQDVQPPRRDKLKLKRCWPV